MRPPEKDRRPGGHLGRGTVAALLLHLQILIPLLVVVFSRAKQEEAERAEEVDVGFESVPAEQLPAELPPLDDTPPPDGKVKPVPTKLAAEQKKPEPKVEPEKKAPEPPPPQPEAAVPPPTPQPQKPPPPPQSKNHEKIVDLDNDKQVEPPPNAKYLAQKNMRAEEETRATHTNLEREQKAEEDSSQAPGKRRDDKEVGDDKAKIAELDEQKSKAGRQAPEVVPHQTTESLPPDPRRVNQKSPVLSLREVSPRGHEITPETVDPSLPHDPAGLLARARARSTFREDDGGKASQGKKVKLALSGHDYEYLFGAESKADRQLAQKERSSHLGRQLQRRMSQVRSSLENFIPDVKPGTSTVLNARAAPFAAFIARVHRQIHKYWGYGALDDWDSLPSSSPFNNSTLATTLEIVLNEDGTVGKITVVKASGYLAYDAAAIDAVYAAGPFPEPPGEILSANGKVYFHWQFARDGRACGTEFVEYYILDNAPDGHSRTHG
ncbi:MAG TPA: TonB family protein [Polyangia bacterium]